MDTITKINKNLLILFFNFVPKLKIQYKMTKITIAKGDGIGPEIMDATLEIILAAGAKIEIEDIEVGEKV
jgi:isocitrate dehydrogenase